MKRGTVPVRGGSSTVRGAKTPTSRATAEQVFGYATIPRNFRGNVNNAGFFNTFNNINGRQSEGGVGTPNPMMSSFRSEVVDGLVMNRFRRPNPNPQFTEANNHAMNMEFYRTPTTPERSTQGNWSPTDSFDSPMSYNNNSSMYPPALPENPPTPRKPPPENKPSLLLNREENQTIFDILGKGRQTLATAVVQLLVPTPNQREWQKKETGVACLVRDTTKKSYFIQVFSLRTKSMVFRQEIYNQFEYHMPVEFFLTFEGDNSMVGINFADPTEATNFREVLDSKLEAKRQRRTEREHRRSRIISDNQNVYTPNPQQQSNHTNPATQYQPQKPVLNGSATVSTTYNFPISTPKFKKSKAKDNKKKQTLRKEDIGKPMDFRHVQHVGWDPKKGFDVDAVDPSLCTFFEKAGVSATQLDDENTRQFIYNFIEENGGLEAIKGSSQSNSRPAAPPPPSSNSGPPPVPNRQAPNQKPAAPPPPPSRPVPPVPGYNQGVPAPPPPPMRTSSSNVIERPQVSYQSPSNNQSNGPARPPPPSIMSQSSPKPIQSNGPIPPPPPPPPPMPGIGAPPPPPPPPMSSSVGQGDQMDAPRTASSTTKSLPPVVDDRSQLMQQIQKGIQLKKVDPVETTPKKSAGGLADCLNQIQRGVDLKPVQQTAKEPPSLDAMDGLAGALARALADRSRAINPDSSSSDDEDEEAPEDDEWD